MLSDPGGHGALVARFGEDPESLPETCSLDVADRGGASDGEIAHYMGITKQRVAQIEYVGLKKLGLPKSRLKQFHEPS